MQKGLKMSKFMMIQDLIQSLVNSNQLKSDLQIHCSGLTAVGEGNERENKLRYKLRLKVQLCPNIVINEIM